MSNKNHISVKAAQQKILRAVRNKRVVNMQLLQSCGYVLAENLKSPINSPPFDNSAMDGYAFRYSDFKHQRLITVIGESAAGKTFDRKVNAGEAVRIFTGAAIPHGADTVVMQEKVSVNENLLQIKDDNIKQGSNIRRSGSQLKKNSMALLKGHLLTPASVGLLSSLGINRVKVYAKPLVTIIVTGDELTSAGRKLEKGKIFESNSATLIAALEKEKIFSVKTLYAADNFRSVKKVFQKAVAGSDIILFSGGISVGDYDFVENVLDSENVKKIFHGVKQKPGKPLYFGTLPGKLIFGLPGNPASVLTCYYEFVLPAVRKFQYHPQQFLPVLKIPLVNSVSKKNALTVFFKAYTDFNSVTVLEGQESYIMKSFAEANCLVVLAEADLHLEKGSIAEVHYFG